MNSSQPSQTNIQSFSRFLSTNNELFSRHFQQHFPSPTTIQSIDGDYLIKYVYQLLSFSRYQQDSVVHSQIIDNLTASVKQFVRDHSLSLFSAEMSVQLLKYFIQRNNQMSIQYHPNINQSANVTSNSSVLGKVEDNPQVNDACKNIIAKQNQFCQSQINNPKQHSILHKTINDKVIQKNAAILFNFYCKQQMAIGVNNTFQYLQYESNTMNLSSFIFFAHSLNIFTTKITKDLIVAKFKRISEGKTKINFYTFYMLLYQLQNVDPTLFHSLKLEGVITKQQLKNRRFPFNTQDQNPREIISIRKISKNTNSSMSKGLNHSLEKINLKKGKSIQIINKNDRYTNQKMLNVKDFEGQEIWSKNQQIYLRKIISPEENDDIWLGQYKIKPPKNKKNKQQTENSYISKQQLIIRDLKKRVNQINQYQNQPKQYNHLRINYKQKQINNKNNFLFYEKQKN